MKNPIVEAVEGLFRDEKGNLRVPLVSTLINGAGEIIKAALTSDSSGSSSNQPQDKDAP